MNDIIVGVDGSEGSIKAARLGGELAKAYGAKAVLAFAQPPIPGDAYWGVVPPEWAELAEANGQQILQEVAEASGQTDAERVMLDGNAAEALSNMANARHAGMLVVGSRGMGAVRRILLGSVGDRVTHLAPCPVLIVR